MRIRFKTKDNLTVIREFPHFRVPPDVIDRPILTAEGKPCDIRRYEYRGEVRNGIPTLHEK
jgi:hypothetical protein